jgi:hypothetical protein
MTAQAKGLHFITNIKNNFPYVKVADQKEAGAVSWMP